MNIYIYICIYKDTLFELCTYIHYYYYFYIYIYIYIYIDIYIYIYIYRYTFVRILPRNAGALKGHRPCFWSSPLLWGGHDGLDEPRRGCGGRLGLRRLGPRRSGGAEWGPGKGGWGVVGAGWGGVFSRETTGQHTANRGKAMAENRGTPGKHTPQIRENPVSTQLFS